jgi:hypothetical protein
MDNFDLKKYLAEGRLFKENLVDFEGNDMYQEIKGDMKRYYKMDVSMDVIKDWADYYFPNRKDEDGIEYEFETSAREDFLDHLEDLKDSNASDEDKELQKQIDIQAKAARRITSRTRDLAMAKGLSMDDYFDSIDEGKLLKEEKYNGAIIRKGTSDKAKEDTKIVRQALKDKGIKFTNRGEFGMDFKNADLAQIKKVIAGAKVGEFIVSHDVDEGKLLKEQQEDILSFLKNNKAELIQVLAKKYGFDEDDIEDHSEYEIRPGYDFDGNEDLEIAGLGESGLDFSFNPEKVKDEYGDASEFIINVGGKKIYGLAYNM